jgi:hypothetical protein
VTLWLVSLCVVVYVFLCMCVSVSLCICLSVYMCICMSLPLFLCGSVYVCMCVSVVMCLCVYVSLSLCVCVAVTLCPAGESDKPPCYTQHNKRHAATRQMSEYTTNERHAATLHNIDKPILSIRSASSYSREITRHSNNDAPLNTRAAR